MEEIQYFVQHTLGEFGGHSELVIMIICFLTSLFGNFIGEKFKIYVVTALSVILCACAILLSVIFSKSFCYHMGPFAYLFNYLRIFQIIIMQFYGDGQFLLGNFIVPGRYKVKTGSKLVLCSDGTYAKKNTYESRETTPIQSLGVYFIKMVFLPYALGSISTMLIYGWFISNVIFQFVLIPLGIPVRVGVFFLLSYIMFTNIKALNNPLFNIIYKPFAILASFKLVLPKIRRVLKETVYIESLLFAVILSGILSCFGISGHQIIDKKSFSYICNSPYSDRQYTLESIDDKDTFRNKLVKTLTGENYYSITYEKNDYSAFITFECVDEDDYDFMLNSVPAYIKELYKIKELPEPDTDEKKKTIEENDKKLLAGCASLRYAEYNQKIAAFHVTYSTDFDKMTSRGEIITNCNYAVLEVDVDALGRIRNARRIKAYEFTMPDPRKLDPMNQLLDVKSTNYVDLPDWINNKKFMF